MPRKVDHAQRRRQIAEAVWRLASSGGLEEVTLRQVAADAGVSARLVQYYFGTRHELLVGALEILNADAEAAAKERIGALGASAGAREVVRAVLLELLPLDDERHARHVVYAVYFVRFLRDPALRAIARGAEPAVEDLIAGLLDAAPSADGAPPLDARREAALLVAAAEGLQAQILLEQVSPQDAVALVDHQLDRILGTAPQGGASSDGPPAHGAGGRRTQA